MKPCPRSGVVRGCRANGSGVQKEIEAGNVAMDHMDPNFKEGMVLVKDKYSSERRKAKILNFSLAYGKTEYGLSKDFNVTLAEAKGIVERWYKSRPEVRCPDAAARPCRQVARAARWCYGDVASARLGLGARVGLGVALWSVCRLPSGRRW